MSKTVFITGATSGIGQASAEIFAQNGFNLVICGRREDRLSQLKKQLGAKISIEYLVFDVRDKNKVLSQVESLPKEYRKIDILINKLHGAISRSNNGSNKDSTSFSKLFKSGVPFST